MPRREPKKKVAKKAPAKKAPAKKAAKKRGPAKTPPAKKAAKTRAPAKRAPAKKRSAKATTPKESPSTKAPRTLQGAARAELDAALELAKISAKRAVNAARALAKRLGDGEEAVAVYDAVADATVEKDPTWAKEAFFCARSIERELGGRAPASRYLPFAEKGALDERELEHVVDLEGGAELLVAAVASGVRATPELVAQVLERGEPFALDVVRGWTKRAKLEELEIDVWLAARPLLPTLFAEDAALRDFALRAFTEETESLPLIAQTGLAESLTGEQAAALAEAVLRRASESLDRSTRAAVQQLLAALRPRVERPLSVTAEDARRSWDRQPIDPALVELVLAEGLAVRVPDADPWTFTFPLHAWSTRDLPEDDLERVGAHPFFGDVLAASFSPRRETDPAWVTRALRAKGCGRVFEALARWVEEIDRWPLGAFEVHAEWLEGLCQPAVLARVPALAAAVRALDPARMLRNQLRAGILDEWGWPAFDDACDRFDDARAASQHGGPFPFKPLFGEGRIVIVGPDAVVLDRPYKHPSGVDATRTIQWVGGDALVVDWNHKGHWVTDGGEPFPLQGSFFDAAVGDAVIRDDEGLFRRGDRAVPFRQDGRAAGRRVWCDGARTWCVAQEFEVDREGRSDKEGPLAVLYPFDPAGGTRGAPSLPAWMAALLEDERDRLIVHIDATYVRPVPEGAERSPLGAKDGLGGFALHTRGANVIATRIDGRSGPGLVNGLYTVHLMTFPEREGLYPIVQSAFDLGVAMPDGRTPLVPMDKVDGPEYHGGTPDLPLHAMHLMRPRDPAASRALAACSDDAARALVVASAGGDATPEHVTDYGNLQAVLTSAPKAIDVSVAMREALARVLPDVKHPRVVRGVASLAAVAKDMHAVCDRLRGHLAAADATGELESALTNQDVSAVAALFDHEMPWWIEKLGTQLGQQIIDVSRWLFSDAPDSVTPARTVLPWELALPRMGELLYRVLALGTPKAAREELRRFLALWRDTELAAEPGRARLVAFATDSIPGLDREHPDRLIAWENRYFVRFQRAAANRTIVRGIEVTRDGVFRLPPGAELHEELRSDARFDREAIDRALALLGERGPMTPSASVVAYISDETGLGRGAAALLAAAGFEPWLVGAKKRAELGLTAEDAELAEVELRGKRLREIYARAMPADPESLYADAPQRLAPEWVATFGKTTPLPAELLARLRADLEEPSLPLERDARALMAPEESSILTKDERWVMRPAFAFDAGARRFHGTLPPGWPKAASMPKGDDNPDRDDFFHGYAMSRFVRYVAWAHLALAGGDPARAGAARVAELVRARLANPRLLVLAALVDLSEVEGDARALFDPFVLRFAGAVYVAEDDGPSADGWDRGDAVVTWPKEKNGAFVAFRPCRLEDDGALARFLDDVGARAAFERTQGAAPVRVEVPGASVICPPSFGHWLTWRARGFQRLVDALRAPLPEGRYASDPRVSAPDAVAAVARALDLDEDAATLHLQTRALPSTKHVARVNGWSDETLARARRALAARDAPPGDPRALYGLVEGDEPTFRVLLPVRPLAELFRDAAR